MFDIVFAVPLECQSCVDSVADALQPLGVKYTISLSQNLVSTYGAVPPSEIVKAIQATGKDAVIRGTGKPDSAAVCILESFETNVQPVKGLARIVAVGPKDLYIDLTVNGLPKGTYYPSIRASGNLSNGALSTGPSFYDLGSIKVESPSNIASAISAVGAATQTSEDLRSGQSFLHANLSINDLIGRSVVLSRLKNDVTPDSLCGVIARSAGAWENGKQVCSCTGKTVWQERTDAIARGASL